MYEEYLDWLVGIDDPILLKSEIIRIRSVLEAFVQSAEKKRPDVFIPEIMFSKAVLEIIPKEEVLERYATLGDETR